MKISVHDIKDYGSELEVTEEAQWLKTAVSSCDEPLPEGMDLRPRHLTSSGTANRKIALKLSLHKTDQILVITGKIKTHVELLCSRCATHFDYPISAKFTSLYCQDPKMAGIGYLDKEDPEGGEGGTRGGTQFGLAKHAHQEDFGNEPDITYISDEFVDLGEVVAEQLRLEIPYQPLCNPECQGVCPHCGADLNRGRCACSKWQKDSPFAVLKKWKGSN